MGNECLKRFFVGEFAAQKYIQNILGKRNPLIPLPVKPVLAI